MMSRVPMFGDQASYTTDSSWARIGFVPPPWSSDLVATREGTTQRTATRYAALSQSRALVARRRGRARSMVPVTGRRGPRAARPRREHPARPTRSEKLATLRTVYEARQRPGRLGTGTRTRAGRHPPRAHRRQCTPYGRRRRRRAGGQNAAAATACRCAPASWARRRPACRSPPRPARSDATQGAARAGLTAADIDLWRCAAPFAAITLHYVSLSLDPERFQRQRQFHRAGPPHGRHRRDAGELPARRDGRPRPALRRGRPARRLSGVATATVFERVARPDRSPGAMAPPRGAPDEDPEHHYTLDCLPSDNPYLSDKQPLPRHEGGRPPRPRYGGKSARSRAT